MCPSLPTEHRAPSGFVPSKLQVGDRHAVLGRCVDQVLPALLGVAVLAEGCGGVLEGSGAAFRGRSGQFDGVLVRLVVAQIAS